MQSCDYRLKVWGRTRNKHFWAIREFIVFLDSIYKPKSILSYMFLVMLKEHFQEMIPVSWKILFPVYFCPFKFSQLPTTYPMQLLRVFLIHFQDRILNSFFPRFLELMVSVRIMLSKAKHKAYQNSEVWWAMNSIKHCIVSMLP